MALSELSWTAMARISSSDEVPTTSDAAASRASFSRPPRPLPSGYPRPRVAFVSGHIDITPEQFSVHYAAKLDTAIRRDDTFVLSNAGGADTLALSYLRSHNVAPPRITVYMHTRRPNRKINATQSCIDKMRLEAADDEKYRREGYSTRLIKGYHAERDAAMTNASDYDILWIRADTETAALYGSKYRPGRISGTQKNQDRRFVREERRGGSVFGWAS